MYGNEDNSQKDHEYIAAVRVQGRTERDSKNSKIHQRGNVGAAAQDRLHYLRNMARPMRRISAPRRCSRAIRRDLSKHASAASHPK